MSSSFFNCSWTQLQRKYHDHTQSLTSNKSKQNWQGTLAELPLRCTTIRRQSLQQSALPWYALRSRVCKRTFFEHCYITGKGVDARDPRETQSRRQALCFSTNNATAVCFFVQQWNPMAKSVARKTIKCILHCLFPFNPQTVFCPNSCFPHKPTRFTRQYVLEVLCPLQSHLWLKAEAVIQLPQRILDHTTTATDHPLWPSGPGFPGVLDFIEADRHQVSTPLCLCLAMDPAFWAQHVPQNHAFIVS